MPRQQRPTQADVARAAGVSPAVVSLVINGHADGKVRISPRTQEHVREAVRRLGYVPNPTARRLAGGRNHILGVFTYEPVFPVQQQDFYYPFLVGIEQQAEARGFDLLLFTSSPASETETNRRQIYRDGVNRLQLADGAILIGTNEDRAELVRLHQEGFPFVFVGCREVDGTELSYVAADYAAATAEVVAHLVGAGHRRMLYIGKVHRLESALHRETGYREAHHRLGLPLDEARICRVPCGEIDGRWLQAWLDAGVTAFVAEQTAHADRLLGAARHLGRRIPEDLSLAALGNPTSSTEAIPGLTTFHIPRREMGAEAVLVLARMLEQPDGADPYRVTLNCTFVPGQTVAPPR